jgi:hypothetical protein
VGILLGMTPRGCWVPAPAEFCQLQGGGRLRSCQVP